MGVDIKKIMKVAYEKYGLQQVPSEWEEFLRFVESRGPETILEIGTGKGGSTYCFSHLCRKLISVDIKHLGSISLRKALHKNCNYHFILDKSAKAINNVVLKLAPQNFFDLIFIDGDHTFAGTRKDFWLYFNFADRAKKGIIALHDIKNTDLHRSQGCNVYKFWEQLRTMDYNKSEIIDPNTNWGGIGLIKL